MFIYDLLVWYNEFVEFITWMDSVTVYYVLGTRLLRGVVLHHGWVAGWCRRFCGERSEKGALWNISNKHGNLVREVNKNTPTTSQHIT